MDIGQSKCLHMKLITMVMMQCTRTFTEMSRFWCIIIVILEISWKNCSAIDEHLMEQLRSLELRHRCTRRYTPGVCLESLQRAWTFNFQIMNCTERLGCPQTLRSNRYSTYERCMLRCQPMVDLYLQILAYGGDNAKKFLLRKIPDSAILRNQPPTERPALQPLPLDYYYPGDEAMLARVIYPDSPSLDQPAKPREDHDYLYLHDHV